jgi:hypothetical protein
MLCTDGVWGVLDDDDLLDSIAQPDLAKSLPNIVSRASQIGGTYADDATAMAIRWLSDIPNKSIKNSIDSSTIMHDFESTMHITIQEAGDYQIMSEEEMDAQILEINLALKKLDSRQ